MTALRDKIAEGRTEATVAKILSNLRTMHELVTGSHAPFDNLNFLHNYDRVRECMHDYTLRSFKTFVASAIVALTVEGDETAAVYRKKHGELKEVVTEQDDSNVKTEKQEERMVPFEELVAARDRLRAKVEAFTECDEDQYQDVQAYMVLCIATMCDVVLRNQELCKMVVRKTWTKDPDATQNYFLIHYNMMELYVYKTAHKYGKMVVPLTMELSTTLKDCLALRPSRYKEGEDVPFLINKNGAPLTLGGGIQRLYERAGLSVSPTIVRNIIATHRSGEELEAVRRVQQNAKNFGHSVEQHVRYIRR